MALLYMEGEVFFKRDALKLESANFGADDETNSYKNFYGHVLVETFWNTYPLNSNTTPSPTQYGQYSSQDQHPRIQNDYTTDTLPGRPLGDTYMACFIHLKSCLEVAAPASATPYKSCSMQTLVNWETRCPAVQRK